MGRATENIVVGIGEVLWDCFGDSRQPGGAPANVAFHAGQLGCTGVVYSRVGDDPLGAELLEHLREHGLSVDYLQVDSDRPTGTVTVDTSDAGHPTYTIHEDVAWDALAYDDRVAELMSRASAVCFGTLAQRDAVSRATIQEAVAAAENALVVYDVNLRQQWYDRALVEGSMKLADVAKLNGDEVAVLASLLELRSTDPREFADELGSRFGVETVCITRAEHGCWVASGSEVAEVPGIAVDVVDAVGAGDAFTAAFIAARLRGLAAAPAVRLANEVGATVAGCAGAMPDCRAAFDALWGKFDG